jgi:purine-cytosine permease-like protein
MTIGTKNAIISLIIGGILAGVGSAVFTFFGSKQGLNCELLTRGAGLGYMGSAVISLIYIFNFALFYAFEGQIMISGLAVYWPAVPMGVWYIAAGVLFCVLTLYGVTLMEKIATPTTPIYFICLIILLVVVNRIGNPDVSWTSYMPDYIDESSGPALLQGIATTFALVVMAPTAADLGRFIKPTEAKKAVVFMGFGFYVITYLVVAMAGIFLAVKLNGDTNPGIYIVTLGGILGVLFIVMTQIRIQVSNVYSGSLALANFFAQVFHLSISRKWWTVVMVVLGVVAMFLDALSNMTTLLAFEGVFVIAWVFTVVADIMVRTLFKVGEKKVQFKRPSMYYFNPCGTIALIIALGIGTPMTLGAFGGYWTSMAGIVSGALAFVLTAIFTLATKGKYQKHANKADVLEGDPEEKLVCERCGGEYVREDMLYCPHLNQTICSVCCTEQNSCKEVCKIKETA